MLNSLPAPFLLEITIFVTALSWGLRAYLVDRKVYVFASLAIASFVCLFGYNIQNLGAPLWVVVAAPIPLDFLLLWYVLRTLRKMFLAYVMIWAIYLVFHVLFSAILHYDSLVPRWRLHS